jgi:LmbE family N-acetylglucosaminyl deacetylase
MDEKPVALAIMAHPDDIEFVCAGTLIALRNAGCSIVMINMATGDCGSAIYSREEAAAIRAKEAQRAAELIGAQHSCVGFGDLTIYRNLESARKVTEAIRRARPTIVITHPPVDYMSDHEETSRLIRDACFTAPMPNFETGAEQPAPVIESPPALYYGDPIEGIGHDGKPAPADFFVNVSDLLDQKAEMLCCHESQRDWLRQQHGIDEYVEMLRSWNAARGNQAGVPFAEAFIQYRGHGFPTENRIAGLIGQRIIDAK